MSTSNGAELNEPSEGQLFSYSVETKHLDATATLALQAANDYCGIVNTIDRHERGSKEKRCGDERSANDSALSTAGGMNINTEAIKWGLMANLIISNANAEWLR